MSAPTLEQQVGALWAALKNPKFYVCGMEHDDGVHVLSLWDSDDIHAYDDDVKPRALFKGATIEECLAQLIAYQVAERLA